MDAKQCSNCGECYRVEARACPTCGSSDARIIKGFQPAGTSTLAGQAQAKVQARTQATDLGQEASGKAGCFLQAVAAAAGVAMVVSFFMPWGQQRPAAVTYLRIGDLLMRGLQPLVKSAGPKVLAVAGPVLAAAYVLISALGGSRYRRHALFLALGGALGLGCAWETRVLLLRGAFGNVTKEVGSGFELFYGAALAALLAGIWGYAQGGSEAKAPEAREGAPARGPVAGQRGAAKASAPAPQGEPAPAARPASPRVTDLSAEELLEQGQRCEASASAVEAQGAITYYRSLCLRFPDHPQAKWAEERIADLSRRRK